MEDLLLQLERLSRHYRWNMWHQRSFDLLLSDIWSMAGTEDALKLDAWHDMWHDAEKKGVVSLLGVKGGAEPSTRTAQSSQTPTTRPSKIWCGGLFASVQTHTACSTGPQNPSDAGRS